MNILSFFGSHLLALSFPTGLFSLLFYLIGYYRKSPQATYAASRALVVTFILITSCVLLIVFGFLTNNFSLHYVYSYSSYSLPVFYKFTGLWAGLDGSLLFWTWLVSLYLFLVYLKHKDKNPDYLPFINATMMSVILFFLGLMIFSNDPFTPMKEVVSDGKGLNPLLQNIAMAVHPPSLYLGFTGFTVPFAFMIAALATRRLDVTWIDLTRKWTIIAWFFLTLGLILGGAWAYVELGWGGFWAWDPVENAALIPWLTGTAYLHSVIIQKKRGLLQVWNVSLIALTFFLTILGTYLTRSGVVQSVHAFSDSNLGPFFLSFMGVIAFSSLFLIFLRYSDLKSNTTHISYISKESAFLLNNIILVVAAVAVIWGTLFPSFSELITGERVSVGPPFFNKIMAPIGVVLLFLMGIGPMVSWRRANFKNIQRNLLVPLIVGIIFLILSLVLGFNEWYTVLSAAGIGFVLATLILEFYRGLNMLKIQKGYSYLTGIPELLFSSNRKYGGYIVHIGVLLIFLAITGIIYKKEANFSLLPGESFDFAGLEVKYVELIQSDNEHFSDLTAKLDIFEDGKLLTTLNPSRHFYHVSGQPTTEVDIHQTPLRDIYLLLGQYSPQNRRADFRITINPLISFMWLGGIIILVGVIILILPKRVNLSAVNSMKSIFLIFFLLTSSNISFANQENHQISDPNTSSRELDLEDPVVQKMWEISPHLLCQCGGCVRESLEVCTCNFARKERKRIIAMVEEGQTEDQIIQGFIDEYGMPVLTVPPKEGLFQIAYLMPTIILVGGFLLGIIFIAIKFRNTKGRDNEVDQGLNNLSEDKYKKLLESELEDL
jgi:cytochrome c-type biogenesis protein CcmF